MTGKGNFSITLLAACKQFDSPAGSTRSRRHYRSMAERIRQLLTRAMGSTLFSYTLKLIWLAGRPSSPLHRRKWRRRAYSLTPNWSMAERQNGHRKSCPVLSTRFCVIVSKFAQYLDREWSSFLTQKKNKRLLAVYPILCRPLQKLKLLTFFLLGSGLPIQLFLLALQPNRRVEKRPWRLYSQATLVQLHKVKLVLTSEFGIIIRIGDVSTQASLKVHTLKRRGFHVFIKASIVKEMIAVNTFNIFKVCWICNCFL